MPLCECMYVTVCMCVSIFRSSFPSRDGFPSRMLCSKSGNFWVEAVVCAAAIGTASTRNKIPAIKKTRCSKMERNVSLLSSAHTEKRSGQHTANSTTATTTRRKKTTDDGKNVCAYTHSPQLSRRHTLGVVYTNTATVYLGSRGWMRWGGRSTAASPYTLHTHAAVFIPFAG